MAVVFLSQSEIDEFECGDFEVEPDTEPFIKLKAVEQQLNGSQSVAQFTSQAQALGYSVNPPEQWGKLEVEMDGAIVSVDAISFLVETA